MLGTPQLALQISDLHLKQAAIHTHNTP
jgi:hypothetical protein